MTRERKQTELRFRPIFAKRAARALFCAGRARIPFGLLLFIWFFAALAQGESVQSTPSAWNSGALGAATALLEKEYKQLGAARRLRPRLLDDDGVFPIVLEDSLLSTKTSSCTTVSVLTSPNVSFLLLFPGDTETLTERAWPIPSAAGAAEITRCGSRRALLRKLAIKLRSRRGVVEFLVLESSSPPPPISELLPERNPGPTLPSPRVGRRPWLAPLNDRVERVKTRSRSEGAESVQQSALPADQVGRGSSLVNFGPGCHRLELLTEAQPDSPPDLDAGLFTLAQGLRVAFDEEHSSQALLQHCVGRPERFRVDFAGARPHGEVTVVHSTWGIPDAFPHSWGPIARSQLAEAAWRHGLHQFQESPVYSSLGVRGTTRLFVPTDPSACYAAIVSPIRGDVQHVALGVQGARKDAETHSTNDKGVSLSFCAEGSTQVKLEIQAMGSGVAWILGLFHMGELSQ